MIQSISRGALILEMLSREPTGSSLGGIAKHVGLPPSTTHGLLKTLCEHLLVVQDGSTSRYALGPSLLRFGQAYLRGSELRLRSGERSSELATATACRVWVTVLAGADTVVVHQEPGPGLGKASDIGLSIPWWESAFGIAAVGGLSTDEIERRLAGARRVEDVDAMRRLIETGSDNGYVAWAPQGPSPYASLASRVVGSDGAVIGAIGLVGAAWHIGLGADEGDRLPHQVLEAAQGLSRDLGATG